MHDQKNRTDIKSKVYHQTNSLVLPNSFKISWNDRIYRRKMRTTKMPRLIDLFPPSLSISFTCRHFTIFHLVFYLIFYHLKFSKLSSQNEITSLQLPHTNSSRFTRNLNFISLQIPQMMFLSL